MERDTLSADTLTKILADWSAAKADTNRAVKKLNDLLNGMSQMQARYGPVVRSAYQAISGTGPAQDMSLRADVVVTLTDVLEGLENRIDDARRLIPSQDQYDGLRRRTQEALETVRRIRRVIQDESPKMAPTKAHKALERSRDDLVALGREYQEILTIVRSL